MAVLLKHQVKKNSLLLGMFGSTILFIVIYVRISIWNWEKIPDIMIVQDRQEYFMKIVTDKEERIYQKLLQGFVELLPNVTYFMMYGTLLGSYRHHGMIPWDADVDMVIRTSDREAAHDIFTSLKPDSEFKFTPHSELIWRFFHNESEETGDPWKWPFLDIYFYLENSTHIWNSYVPEIKFEKSLIFPLIKRPYMGLFLPSPRCPKSILEKSYDLNVCVWTYYSGFESRRTMKKFKWMERLLCEYLYDKFPFVKRQANGTGMIETLELGNVKVPGSNPFFSET